METNVLMTKNSRKMELMTFFQVGWIRHVQASSQGDCDDTDRGQFTQSASFLNQPPLWDLLCHLLPICILSDNVEAGTRQSDRILTRDMIHGDCGTARYCLRLEAKEAEIWTFEPGQCPTFRQEWKSLDALQGWIVSEKSSANFLFLGGIYSSLFSVQKNDILPSTLCKIVTGCTL